MEGKRQVVSVCDRIIIYIELSRESTEKLLEWIGIQKGSWILDQPKNNQLHFSTPVVTNPHPERERKCETE